MMWWKMTKKPNIKEKVAKMIETIDFENEMLEYKSKLEDRDTGFIIFREQPIKNGEYGFRVATYDYVEEFSAEGEYVFEANVEDYDWCIKKITEEIKRKIMLYIMEKR
jgi:hypothetical protein